MGEKKRGDNKIGKGEIQKGRGTLDKEVERQGGIMGNGK